MRRGQWLLVGLLLALAGCNEGVKPEPLPRAPGSGPRQEAARDPVGAKRKTALFQTHLVTRALFDYKTDHGEYPAALPALARPGQRGEPYLSEQLLIDPWGRPYRIDPAGTKNGGFRPDVWSEGPDGRPGQEIGNWMSLDD